MRLQALCEGRGCQPLRSSPPRGFTDYAGSALSTIGLSLQAILLVTCGLTAHVDYLCCCRIKYVKDLCRKKCLIALALSLHCKDITSFLVGKIYGKFFCCSCCNNLVISIEQIQIFSLRTKRKHQKREGRTLIRHVSASCVRTYYYSLA